MAIETIGPASTPLLYLENQNQLMLQQAADWENDLKRQRLDPETYADEIQKRQVEVDDLQSEFQARTQMMQQSQKFVDLGLISPEESQEAMWAQVLPGELFDKLYPKQATDPQRVPFSPGQMEKHQEYIEDFTKKGMTGKRYGALRIDWLKKDVAPSLSTILEKYDAWKVNIGYGAMTFNQQGQVDSEWDAWIAHKGWKNWNPELEAVKTRRARGPLTRAFGSQFRGTPTGPREATNPLQDSIALNLSKKKKKQPTAKELNQNKTWENYELGKSLGYWK